MLMLHDDKRKEISKKKSNSSQSNTENVYSRYDSAVRVLHRMQYVCIYILYIVVIQYEVQTKACKKNQIFIQID